MNLHQNYISKMLLCVFIRKKIKHQMKTYTGCCRNTYLVLDSHQYGKLELTQMIEVTPSTYRTIFSKTNGDDDALSRGTPYVIR